MVPGVIIPYTWAASSSRSRGACGPTAPDAHDRPTPDDIFIDRSTDADPDGMLTRVDHSPASEMRLKNAHSEHAQEIKRLQNDMDEGQTVARNAEEEDLLGLLG